MSQEMQQQQSEQNEPEGGKPRVFVYGTLKQGEGNHRLLEQGGGRFLGPASIHGNYVMRDLGWYPCVVRVPDGPNSAIHGEVYEVDDELLATLDILEGHPNYYRRQKVQTSVEGYRGVWIYLLNGAFAEAGEPVEGGYWTGGEDA